jgi:hypothetical protein
MKRRIGKIARLSEKQREFVNLNLTNGSTYVQIAAQLKQMGATNITAQNVQNWKQGGYQEWLKAKERQDFILLQSNKLLQRGKDPDALSFGITTLGIAQLWSVLTEFDPTHLKQRLAESPERYFDLLLSFSRLLKSRYALMDHIASEHPDPRQQKWWSNFMDEMLERSEMYKALNEAQKNRYNDDDEEEDDKKVQTNNTPETQNPPTPDPAVSSSDTDPQPT